MPAAGKTPHAHFKLYDILFFTVSLAAVCVSFVFALQSRTGTLRLAVETAEGQWIYSLGTNTELHFSGPLGTTTVLIENGAAHVHDSPCENKTCMACSPISRAGEWTACLPNRVIMRIESTSSSPDSLDALGF